jgi:FkbM family methyltransferase
MLEGGYERFFFDYFKDLPMRGKVVLEIGAHIGFHAMNFAKLVGEDGQVYAFEPNEYNRKRMEIIFERNADLAKRITILGVALSDKEGETIFYFSDDVDRGMSCGSFTPQSHAFYQNNKKYIKLYRETKVRAVTLDGINNYLGKEIVPYVIKVDVEDAESSVLEGGLNLIKKTNPYLLVEVHSVFSMFNMFKLLNHIGYTMNLLKEEPDGRCFIAAQPPRP